MKKNIVLCFERVEKSGRLKRGGGKPVSDDVNGMWRRVRQHGGNAENVKANITDTHNQDAFKKLVLKITNICFI